MFFKIKTYIRRSLSRLLEMHRPASQPFLSGDGFRSAAHFIYDQFMDFKPQDVSYADIVFVRNSHLSDFFKKIHPLVAAPYVLISHNEDSSVGAEQVKNIDGKILHWYAENLAVKHPKVTLLPIGIQNFTVGRPENFVHEYLKEKTAGGDDKNEAKKDRILFGFTVGNNPERKELMGLVPASGLIDNVDIPRGAYYSTLKGYKFTASPRGAGIDTHRAWEALYFRVMPIMLRNDFSEQIADLGYPVMLVNSWQELLNIRAEDLASFYEENKAKFGQPHMYLPYWFEQFTQYQQRAQTRV